jgi:hypothetical protein
MARTPAPYETKHGRRWRVGYSDEHGVERTRGGFLRRGHASAWYRQLEQARSEGRLREFLDEDAGAAAEQVETLHDFMVDWFRLAVLPLDLLNAGDGCSAAGGAVRAPAVEVADEG